jgi:hypothetical protein
MLCVVALRSFHFAMWLLHLPSQHFTCKTRPFQFHSGLGLYIPPLLVSAIPHVALDIPSYPSHPSSLPPAARSSLTLPSVKRPWRQTHLPFQSLTFPRKLKLLLPSPSSERSLLEHRCEVGTTSVRACLLADIVSLCSPIACSSQARTESCRARRSWTLHRLGGVLERAVSTNTGRMRQTSHHQHKARAIQPTTLESIRHYSRSRYKRTSCKT